VSASELERLDGDIRKLYEADYIKYWENLLADLRIVPFNNTRHGMEVLEVLSGPASPVVSLLEAVDHNTSLTRLPAGAQNVAEQAVETAKTKSRLARLLDKASDVDVQSPVALPGSKVERRFQPLNRLVQTKDNRLPPIERLIALLSELYGQLATVTDSYAASAPGMGRSGDGLQSSLQRLQMEGARQPQPVKGWMQQLAYNTRAVSIGSAREQLNAVWTSTIRPACETALTDRYPFAKDAPLEVTVDDFGRFFGPGGELELFFDKHIKPLADTSQRTWQWHADGKDDAGFSHQALRQMQYAATIREAFFQDGGRTPGVHFALKPVYLDAEVTRFLLDIGGQRFVYRHGPAVSADAQWPGSGRSDHVRIVFDTTDGTQSNISREGPWAWFRILDQADIHVTSPDRFIATFEADGHIAKYEVRASSVVNPFMLEDLQRFRCPEEF
jgi:type VI secretion system protein ImpL